MQKIKLTFLELPVFLNYSTKTSQQISKFHISTVFVRNNFDWFLQLVEGPQHNVPHEHPEFVAISCSCWVLAVSVNHTGMSPCSVSESYRDFRGLILEGLPPTQAQYEPQASPDLEACALRHEVSWGKQLKWNSAKLPLHWEVLNPCQWTHSSPTTG